jgi:hypothetical protein
MKKKLNYVLSNKSGIGDRMMDIMLMNTFANFIDAKLYLNWSDSEKMLMGNKTNIPSIIRHEKTPYRSRDFKFKNFTKFLELPNDINFVSELEIIKLSKSTNTINFCDYLGMQYSPHAFLDKYLTPLPSEERTRFIENYMQNFKLIKFKNIPSDIINLFVNTEITAIHLRRSDKVVVNPDKVSISIDEVENLDKITEAFCNYLISKGKKNILFVSDEKEVKLKYLEKFKHKCNAIIINVDEILQTYVDLYCLAHAECILMSQKFSAFSLFASCINQTKLYYIYSNPILESYNHTVNISTLNLS